MGRRGPVRSLGPVEVVGQQGLGVRAADARNIVQFDHMQPERFMLGRTDAKTLLSYHLYRAQNTHRDVTTQC